MNPITDHLARFQTKTAFKKSGANERGELLKYFSEKVGKPIGYVAFRLTGLKLPDLYYIKSVCDSEERRGEPWAKVFYGSLKSRPN